MSEINPEYIAPQPLPNLEELAQRSNQAREDLSVANTKYELSMTAYALALKQKVGAKVSFSGYPEWYVFDPAKAFADAKKTEESAESTVPQQKKHKFRSPQATPQAIDQPRLVAVPCRTGFEEGERTSTQFENFNLLDVFEGDFAGSGRWMVRVGAGETAFYEVPLNQVDNLRVVNTEVAET